MADQPFLFFPPPVAATKAKLGGGGGSFTKPTPAQQKARLDKKFQQLATSFQTVQPTIQGADPDQVIVLETLTASVDNVAKAASKIPGLEWLSELDLGETAPAYGFAEAGDPKVPVPRRLYALFTNQGAMEQLLKLWQDWLQLPRQRASNVVWTVQEPLHQPVRRAALEHEGPPGGYRYP